MEDLLECPVCMDRYTMEGEKLPRVFVCEHTFCHSCIKNLVKRGSSVTCPTCRHRHKCCNAERLPRNLTLLQLIESECNKTLLVEPKRISTCCSKCQKNEAFCEKCTIASDEAECRSCLKKNLRAQVSQLQKLLTQGKESCAKIPESTHSYLTDYVKNINSRAWSEYGRRFEINELCSTFIEMVNKNHEQDNVLRQDVVSRFLTFHAKATQKLHAFRINLRRDVVTCNTGSLLTALSNECEMHLHRLEETRDAMLLRQRETMDISNRLSIHQRPSFRIPECENLVWDKIRKRATRYVYLLGLLTALLGVWIVIGFSHDMSCPDEDSVDDVCPTLMTLSGRFPIVLITCAFAYIIFSYPKEQFDTAPPPPHIMNQIRQEVIAMTDFVIWIVAGAFYFARNHGENVRTWRPPKAILSKTQRRKIRHIR